MASTSMRPKPLASFRQIVNERGEQLRKLRFEELRQLGDAPLEHLEVDSHPATIVIIVQSLPSGGIRVVVQGLMKARILGKHVALDGFYKYADETVAPMPDGEFYEFD